MVWWQTLFQKQKKIKGKFWDYFEKNTLAAVGKIGPLFVSAFGHTSYITHSPVKEKRKLLFQPSTISTFDLKIGP